MAQKHVKNYLRYFNIGIDDVWSCELCGKVRPINNGLQIHHIIYRSHMGTDDVENCMCLCVDCHNMAHNSKLSTEYLKKLHEQFIKNKI